jgi:PAS domain S-box-containing protein
MKKIVTLYHKLLRLVLLRLFVPLMVLGFVALVGAGYIGERIIESAQRQTVFFIAQQVDRYLNHGVRILDAIARTAESSSAQNLDMFLQSAWQASGHFETIYVLDTNRKTVLLAPPDPRYRDLDMSNLPYFQPAFPNISEGENPRISRAFISLRTGNPTVCLVRPLPRGGAVVGELSLVSLQNEITLGQGGRGALMVFVLDQFGTLLVHPSKQLVQQQTNQGTLAIFRSGSAGDSTQVYDYEGIMMLGSATREKQSGWIVVAQTPLVDTFMPYAAALGAAFLISVAIWLALGWNLRQQLMRRIVAPLVLLRQTTTALAQGDTLPAAEFAIPEAFSEVHELAEDFGRMSRAVRAREAALRESREQLRASEAKYRIVADNTNSWEFWFGPDGRFLYTSPSCQCVSGYTPADFEANPMLMEELIHPDDRELFAKHRREAMSGHSSGIQDEQEYRIIHRDGMQRWIGHICTPIFDPHGIFLGTRGSNRDITKRKLAENFRDDVERIIRHDIKAPLASLHSMAQFALDDELDADLRASIPGLMHAIRNVINLVNSSEKILQMECGEYNVQGKRFNLRDVMYNVEISLDSLTKSRRVQLIQTGMLDGSKPVEKPELFGDEFLIEDMLINLVKNAVEASPECSEVTVSCRIDQADQRIDIHNFGTVPEAIRDRFFEKYATAGKIHGTGLGTYSAQLIAKAHGGRIAFTTLEAEGTTVTVLLPLPVPTDHSQ